MKSERIGSSSTRQISIFMYKVNCIFVSEIKQILAEENVEHEVRGVYGVYDIVLKLISDDAVKLRSIITNKIRKINKVQATLTMMVIEEQENL